MYVESSIETAALPTSWRLPKKWGEWALSVRHDWTEVHVRALAKRFKEYHHDNKTAKPDWEIVWRNWVRRQQTESLGIDSKKSSWWQSASGIEEKGIELGVTLQEGELFPFYKLRVFASAGSGPWNKHQTEGIKNV